MNLQMFDNLIIYSTPISAIHFAQVLARIQRLNSPHKKVKISTLFYEGTVEEETLQRHLKKMQKFDNIDELIENY